MRDKALVLFAGIVVMFLNLPCGIGATDKGLSELKTINAKMKIDVQWTQAYMEKAFDTKLKYDAKMTQSQPKAYYSWYDSPAAKQGLINAIKVAWETEKTSKQPHMVVFDFNENAITKDDIIRLFGANPKQSEEPPISGKEPRLSLVYGDTGIGAKKNRFVQVDFLGTKSKPTTVESITFEVLGGSK